MKKAYILILIITITSIGFWSFSQATSNEINLCVKKGGSVYVITQENRKPECIKNDTLLTWNAKGEKGDQGDKGDSGVSGYEKVFGNTTDLHIVNEYSESNELLNQYYAGNAVSTATCPSGKKVISGGYVDDIDSPLSGKEGFSQGYIVFNERNSENTSWLVKRSIGYNSPQIQAYAICASI